MIGIDVLLQVPVPGSFIIQRAITQVHHRTRDQRKGSQKIGKEVFGTGIVFHYGSQKEESVELEDISRPDDGAVKFLEIVGLPDKIGVQHRPARVELVRHLQVQTT